MPDASPAAAPAPRRRTFVSFAPATLAAIDDLAALRFGGNRSRALEAAALLAAEVLSEPATLPHGADTRAALAAYCASRGAPAPDAKGGGPGA